MSAPDYAQINNTLAKTAHYLGNHESIAVSVSGGSDSDIIVHMICTYFREFLPKVNFVFCDTGLEYNATKQHLVYLEEKYGIKIDRIRGMSIVTAVRQYGVPIISKEHAKRIAEFCRGAKLATSVVYGGRGSRFDFTPSRRALAIAVKERGIKVSSACCDKSKKRPFAIYAKEHNIDLSVTGERRAEGGIRAVTHKSCFEKSSSHHYDKFMPLFFWSDETKAYYKESEGIRYSDCYEVYGMKRTGCAGCPFNSRAHYDLEIMKKYEPTLYKACLNVFGESYRLMDEFHIRRVPILAESEPTIFDLVEEEKNESVE